ncbi:amidohydrolase [Halobacteriales archaeon SW_12_67_38]|nr:MAG: amidohydrolase [Halobacteriales archaeon SW_12_67_38]
MYALTNATVHTATDRGTVDGGVLVEGSEIRAVGDIDVPDGAEVLDCDGEHVTPGLIDAHSHAGMAEWGEPEDADINELTDPVTPHVSALDGFHPHDEELDHAVQGGVTTVSARMGSANVIGGVICSMKTQGNLADEMFLREDGMKAAMGENPKRTHGEQRDREPATRSGVAATLREALMRAEDYRDRRDHAAEEGEPFERDLGMENLVRVLAGDLPLRVHAHRADDIMTVFRIVEEFGIDEFSIEHATTFETPGLLHEAGVTVAIQTDAPVLPQEHLDVCVGLAVREGLPADAALDTVTRNPAAILGIEDRVGTLEEGTDADLAVWNDEFYTFDSTAQHVFVDGEHVFDHERDATDLREEWER